MCLKCATHKGFLLRGYLPNEEEDPCETLQSIAYYQYTVQKCVHLDGVFLTEDLDGVNKPDHGHSFWMGFLN